MIAQPHLIRMRLSTYPDIIIDCPGVTRENDCLTYTEVDECQCAVVDCMCRPGPNGEEPDHWGCSEYSIYVGSLGAPPCRTVPVEGECGVKTYADEIGFDILGSDDWPSEYPWRARVEWSGDGEWPELHPWREA